MIPYTNKGSALAPSFPLYLVHSAVISYVGRCVVVYHRHCSHLWFSLLNFFPNRSHTFYTGPHQIISQFYASAAQCSTTVEAVPPRSLGEKNSPCFSIHAIQDGTPRLGSSQGRRIVWLHSPNQGSQSHSTYYYYKLLVLTTLPFYIIDEWLAQIRRRHQGLLDGEVSSIYLL
jgi:hypothetical protein